MKHITLLLITTLCCTAMSTAQVADDIDSTERTNVVAYAMNTGSVLYNKPAGRHGLEWPRGSGHMFIFGAGAWIGARVQLANGADSIVFMSFNPNSGSSWARPLTDIQHSYEENKEILKWSFDDVDLERYEGSVERRTREGFPLGLHVDQEMVGWINGPYANTLLIKTTVTNTSPTAPLYDLALGMAMDIDVGTRDAGRDIIYHDRVGIIRNEPMPILRVFDTLDRALGTMGMAFIETLGGARLTSCSMWPNWVEMYDHDRYEFLTKGYLDTNMTFAGMDARPILASTPIDLQPGASTSIMLLLTFDPEVSDAADQRIKNIVDGFDLNTSVSEDRSAHTVLLTPNPTSGADVVYFDRHLTNATITIVDLLGRGRALPVNTTNMIDVSDLEAGLYIMRIESAGTVQHTSLIVTR